MPSAEITPSPLHPLTRTLMDRQANDEAGLARPRLHLDRAVVLLDDPQADVEPQAGADTHVLSRKEGLEDPALHLGRDAWPIVGDLDHREVVLVACDHPDGAVPAHRVDRIVEQV